MRERRRDESTVALLAARRVGSAGLTVPPLLASIVSPRGCSKREMEEACARRDAEEGGVSGISDKGSGGRPKLGATRGNNVEHRRNENPGGGRGDNRAFNPPPLPPSPPPHSFRKNAQRDRDFFRP